MEHFHEANKRQNELRDLLKGSPKIGHPESAAKERVPGGAESEDINTMSTFRDGEREFRGMYRGRWLKDMTREELMELALALQERINELRLEIQDRVGRGEQENAE